MMEDGEDSAKMVAWELYEENGHRAREFKHLKKASIRRERESSRSTLIFASGCGGDTPFEPQRSIVVCDVPLMTFRQLVRGGEFEHLIGPSAVLLTAWKYGIAVGP